MVLHSLRRIFVNIAPFDCAGGAQNDFLRTVAGACAEAGDVSVQTVFVSWDSSAARADVAVLPKLVFCAQGRTGAVHKPGAAQ